MNVTEIQIVIGALDRVTKGLIEEGFGNKRTREEHPNYSFVEIGQNIEKSPEDLRKLLVSETSVENYQLTLF